MTTSLLDFAVITIFARETLEGGIIIGEYRTVILRSDWRNADITQREALRAVTVAAFAAAALALVVCAAVAIPLALLSRDFNDKTASLIEGASKIVAAICILVLSLKLPKFFGLYYSKSDALKIKAGTPLDQTKGMANNGLNLRSIRFNVAWNIWREVAECGVFLIPSFLTGEGIKAIPLSAVIGILVGGAICLGIYYANSKIKNTVGLTVCTVGLLLLLSTGLFSGGCHKFEIVYGDTPTVWVLEDQFWSVDRLPMTIFKPFGYSDVRTVLEMVTFWVWLFFSLLLHYRKYRLCRKPATENEDIETRDSDTKDDGQPILPESESAESERKTESASADTSIMDAPSSSRKQDSYDDVEVGETGIIVNA